MDKYDDLLKGVGTNQSCPNRHKAPKKQLKLEKQRAERREQFRVD